MGGDTSAAGSTAATSPPRIAIPDLDDLCLKSNDELARVGLTAMSLACSTGLPGAEDVDPADYFARVRDWAGLVRQQTRRYANAFQRNPAEFDHSEGVFRMMVLVQVLKRDLSVHFNPERALPLDIASPMGFLDSRDVLIHGPLGPTRSGTCNNIPMVVVAVARELGYPVYLACNAHHAYVKWFEPTGNTFNIEASCPGGMNSYSDDHYRDWPHPMSDLQTRSGCYLRPMTPAEELALCIVSRTWVLEANHRFAEATDAYLRATSLWPAERCGSASPGGASVGGCAPFTMRANRSRSAFGSPTLKRSST